MYFFLIYLESDSNQEEEDEEMLPIEKMNKKLKKQKKQEEKEAEDELQLNIENQEKFQFPEDETDQVNSLQVQICNGILFNLKFKLVFNAGSPTKNPGNRHCFIGFWKEQGPGTFQK